MSIFEIDENKALMPIALGSKDRGLHIPVA